MPTSHSGIFKQLIIISLAIFLHGGFNIAYAEEEKQPSWYSEIIRLDTEDPDGDLNSRLEQGAVMLYRRDDLALMYFPYPEAQRATTRSSGSAKAPYAHGSAREYAYGKKPRMRSVPTMDVALSVSGVDRILTGRSLPAAFNGEGVVVGLCDIGIDTRHINFRDKDGNLRIRRVVKYTESEGLREVYDTPSGILEFRTDNPDEYHATHVAGIMAGSYPMEQCQEDQSTGLAIGVASGAEIVATLSELTDVGLLAGVEDIIAYAKSVNKPAVINLSMGNYIGPHDGTSLFCQYLDRCGEDAIICLSAGNEGKSTIHQYSPAATESSPLRVRIAGSDWVNLTLYGETDIYCEDDTPFTLSLRISDSTLDATDPFIYETAPINLSSEPLRVFTTSEGSDDPAVVFDEEFARYFDGNVYIEGGTDPENGRYHARVMYDCITETLFSEEKPWAKYRLELIARPVKSVRLDAFADGSHSWLGNWYGNPLPPGNELSISDLATGFRTISVGMYCTGQSVVLPDGSVYDGEFSTPLRVTNYSSYGTLPDGRRLPATVGPGMSIVSSWSGAFVEAHGDANCSMHANDAAGVSHYWGPMAGTSMSSPFVAGTIATWLQADPSLTVDDVREIILSTNFMPDISDDQENPRYGMGNFDGYAGLLKVLDRTGTTTIGDSLNSLSAHLASGHLQILNLSGEPVSIEVYSLGGLSIDKFIAGTDRHFSVPVSSLRSDGAPVIIRVTTPSSSPIVLKVV